MGNRAGPSHDARLVDSRGQRKETSVAQSGDVLELPNLGMKIVVPADLGGDERRRCSSTT